MSNITVTNLVKDYQGNGLSVRALDSVDLTINQGEFSAIAGPSGSGKTTLLNIMGGLDNPSRGRVMIGDRDLSKMSAGELSDLRLNRIGFIFQAYNLIPVLSAVENVEYILLLQGKGRTERREKALRVLGEVGLAREADRLPRELSGGQQQRVAVARAIVSGPVLVLADEPTANLDQKTGAALLDLMHQLNRDKGVTFLFSTHDGMVMQRAERLIHLADGRIVSDTERGKKNSLSKRRAPASGRA